MRVHCAQLLGEKRPHGEPGLAAGDVWALAQRPAMLHALQNCLSVNYP